MSIPRLFLTQHHRAQPLSVQSLAFTARKTIAKRYELPDVAWDLAADIFTGAAVANVRAPMIA
ncbi:hypothetical protein [Pseudomonas syringae group genomosp. 3]|uniref:hypothetical protein n=1 Tax=Pseudomonas syringae group genomosp. 3 TaxID=251701 RepID=UPI000710424A